MTPEFTKGTIASATQYDDYVIVQRVWKWPFPYVEALTADDDLVSIPLSRLTAITWQFD